MLYTFIQWLLRVGVRVFYRQIEVVGLEHVPPGGVIFAGNHPNSLLDPILVIAFGGRRVSFAAKDTLFRSRLLRFFLDGLGAVPIARRADHSGGALDNAGAFDRLLDVLGGGGAIGIFPEGLSHDDAQISQLKTGAARIALLTAERHPGRPLSIVPVGLTYVRRRRFRSRVLIQLGPPIPVDAARSAAWAQDQKSAARDLTGAIDKGLRALTVNATDWDTVRVLDGVRRLYQPARVPLEIRTELARRFNEVYPRIQDDPHVRVTFAAMHAYLQRLREAHLDDRDLLRDIGPGDALARISRHAVLMLVWLPLAIPGAIVHLPLVALASWTGAALSPRKDVIATTKFVVGLLGMVLAFVGVLIGVWIAWGPLVAAVAALLLPLSGWATVQVLERGASMRNVTLTLVRLTRLGREIDALRTERARLEAEILRLVGRHLPADMAPLFPDRAAPLSPPPADGAAPPA